MDLGVLQQLVTSAGPSAALVMFFVWQGWHREKRLQARVAALEKFTQTTLLQMCERSAVAINQNTVALARLDEHLKGHDGA